MALKDWKNLPDTTTPMTADNLKNDGEYLNEKISGTELYNDAAGTNENVTLSDNVSNYKYIEIYYKRTATSTQGNEGYCSMKFWVRDYHLNYPYSISLNANYTGNTQVLYYNANYSINPNNNNVLTLLNYSRLQYALADGSLAMDTNTNYIYIIRVVGYK